MAQYRKQPVVIEALQYNGENAEAIVAWSGGKVRIAKHVDPTDADGSLQIETLEGTLIARKSDWIIQGVKGEFYPCQSEIFAATYSEVTDNTPWFGFDKALQILKSGGKVSRMSWDNKDCFLAINHFGKEIATSDLWTTQIKEHLEKSGQKVAKIEGNIMMLGWGNKVCNWCPTPSDLLENDWFEVI